MANDRLAAVARRSNREDAPEGLDALREIERVGEAFAQIGRDFHARGWTLGTSGNFSAVLARSPQQIAITATGVDLGRISAADVVLVDGSGASIAGTAAPSAELPLHLAIQEATGADAVLHTHSVAATLCSERVGPGESIELTGHEMLKALPGVGNHLHRERVPVIENSQEMGPLCEDAMAALGNQPSAHGILIRRHGLYAWGPSLAAAKAGIEGLEFLFELMERSDRSVRAEVGERS